jgi:endonuclease/exonuclease/phosphatase family metal-dependent hydrolase
MRIAFLNCYCFPDERRFNFLKWWGFDIHERVTLKPKERIYNIAQYIKKYNPDIICFQELWGKKNKYHMIRHFNEYSYIRDSSTGRFGGIGVDSGLLTLSKIPFVENIITVFPVRGKYENQLANKGALASMFKVSKRNFLVVNTHLNGNLAKLQMDHIYNNLLSDLNNDCIQLLCGDLNVKVGNDKKEWDFKILDNVISTTRLKHCQIPIQNGSRFEKDGILLDHLVTTHPYKVQNYIVDRHLINYKFTDHALSIVDIEL